MSSRRRLSGLLIDLRHLGVRGLVMRRPNAECHCETAFGADDYLDDADVASFDHRLSCNKCGGKDVDVPPN
jgi:hypothetical protein